LWDQGGYILVAFCPFIDGAVVLHWSELSILLFDKEVSGVGAPGFSYGSSFKVFLDEVVDFLDFFLIEG